MGATTQGKHEKIQGRAVGHRRHGQELPARSDRSSGAATRGRLRLRRRQGRQGRGTIARRAPTGVLATRNIDEILALDADVVIHAARLAPPYGSHDADILRLLAAGKNVISINGYSRPQHWGGERVAALESACRNGGTSLLGAGLNPGYAGEQIAVAGTVINAIPIVCAAPPPV